MPYGSGLNNDTYCAVFTQAATSVRCLFQRINHNVFKHTVAHPLKDVHSTILHLLGLDDNKLTYFHAADSSN